MTNHHPSDDTAPIDTHEVTDTDELIDAEVVEELPPLGIDLPDDVIEANEILKSALREAKAEAANYLDSWQRAAADFDNLRKRSLREQQQVRETAAERVVGSLLPTLDSFQAALELPTETDNEAKLLDGMRATLTQLLDVLAREGLQPIPGVGAPFDPNVHEAVTQLGDGDNLVVVGELRRGYTLRDKVVRPASVAVGPGESEAQDATDTTRNGTE